MPPSRCLSPPTSTTPRFRWVVALRVCRFRPSVGADLQRRHQGLARLFELQVLVGVDRLLVQVAHLGQRLGVLRPRHAQGGRHSTDQARRPAATRAEVLRRAVTLAARASWAQLAASSLAEVLRHVAVEPMPGRPHGSATRPLAVGVDGRTGGTGVARGQRPILRAKMRKTRRRLSASLRWCRRVAVGALVVSALAWGRTGTAGRPTGPPPRTRNPIWTTPRRPRPATSTCWSTSGTTSDRRPGRHALDGGAAQRPERAVDQLHRDPLRLRWRTPSAPPRPCAANPAVESVDWDAPATPVARLDPGSDGDALAARAGPPSAVCDRARREAGTEHAGFPNDPCYQYQWHLRQVGLPGAWKLGQGQGVIVAVIDTGVTQVPDLAGTELVAGLQLRRPTARTRADDHGHGTHVAGTIAQATNNKLGVAGVAFGAKIMPLKVLSAQGSGSMGAIAQAIRYAADNGAQVINMSLGGPFPVAAIRSAVKYARGQGRRSWWPPPATTAGAGSATRRSTPRCSRWPPPSSTRRTTFYSNWGAEVDIAAPGGNVRVDQNGDGKPDGVLQNTVVPGNIAKTDYLWFMGTSMASPHVAGVAALLVGRGREQARRPGRPAARHRPGPQGGARPRPRRQPPGGRPLRRRHRRRRRRPARRPGSTGARAAWAWPRRWRCWVWLGCAAGASLAALGWSMPAGLRRWAPAACSSCPCCSSCPPRWRSWAAASPRPSPPPSPAWAWATRCCSAPPCPSPPSPCWPASRRLRPALGGLAFGVAGALAALAITALVDVRFVPDVLDRAWLALNAIACALLGRAVLRK